MTSSYRFVNGSWFGLQRIVHYLYPTRPGSPYNYALEVRVYGS
jgi:hypothetical protein